MPAIIHPKRKLEVSIPLTRMPLTQGPDPAVFTMADMTAGSVFSRTYSTNLGDMGSVYGRVSEAL